MSLRIFVCLIACGLGPLAVGENLAGKLGLDPQSKLLILHGDDLGMCRAANRAAEQALTRGAMSSGSVMVPCPWFPQMAAWSKRHAGHDLGLHLTLTSEWKHYRWGPVSDRSKVRGLLDPAGFLWRSVAGVVSKASGSQVKAEILAQIKRARKFGLEPTHLDSHMGTLFAHPSFFMAYIEVARQERIVPMIPRITDDRAAELKKKGLLMLAKMMILATEKRGYPIIDRLISTRGGTYAVRKAWLIQLIQGLKPGVTQVILHPAEASDELRHITNSHRARSDDLKLMLDPDVGKAMTQAGVKPFQWKTINTWWNKRIVAEEEK